MILKFFVTRFVDDKQRSHRNVNHRCYDSSYKR